MKAALSPNESRPVTLGILCVLIACAKCMTLDGGHEDNAIDPSALAAHEIPRARLLPNRTNDSTVNIQHVAHAYHTPAHMTLEERIELEKFTWHWYPYRRINYKILSDGTTAEVLCDEGSAIDDLPDDVFTQEQRLQGAIVLHFIATIYFFTFLAYVVGEYFLPSIECICEDLNLTQDIAAATFMAIAGTIPEFFTNTISTLLIDSDMGVGAIMGSLLFNTLGVAALAGLATKKPVQLDWFPISRDSCMFSFNLAFLIGFAWDGRIYWYEAMVLVILFVVYFVIMFQNKHIMRLAKKYIEVKWNLCARVIRNIEETERAEAEEAAAEIARLEAQGVPSIDKRISVLTQKSAQKAQLRVSTASILSEQMAERPMKAGDLQIPTRHTLPDADDDSPMVLFKISRESWFRTFWWFYTWPIRLVVTFTIPHPNMIRRLYPLTFIMCIIYIALCSFMVFWMVSIIGYTFGIPDAVMGLTFLAMGGCLPEAVSAVLVIRTGNGAMGVSNALGANSLSILFSLGLPWFIRTMVDKTNGDKDYMVIASYGMQYSIISLLFAVAGLNIVVYIAKYMLRKRVGLALITIYGLILTFMLLNELDVIIPSGDDC